MNTIDVLPATQQTVLRAALSGGLVKKGPRGYAGPDGATYPARTINALWRAELIEVDGKQARLTDLGRSVVEGHA